MKTEYWLTSAGLQVVVITKHPMGADIRVVHTMQLCVTARKIFEETES